MNCIDCIYFDKPGYGLCGCEKSEHFGTERTCKDSDVCIEYEPRRAGKKPGNALALAQNVDKLGQYLMQLGTMMGAMQRRLDEMEERQARVTISHADVKRLQALVRVRADEICGKYNLQDKDSPKIFRAAIKRDLQKRFLVKDLHDLPEAAYQRAEALIGSWVNIRMAMERRGSA